MNKEIEKEVANKEKKKVKIVIRIVNNQLRRKMIWSSYGDCAISICRKQKKQKQKKNDQNISKYLRFQNKWKLIVQCWIW